jgi:hypothetical protein
MEHLKTKYALLAGVLRRANQHPRASDLILRGSILTNALCSGARAAHDVDFLCRGQYDEASTIALAKEIIAMPDSRTTLWLESINPIWAGTRFPGLRVFCTGTVPGYELQDLQIDFAFHEPILLEPRATLIPEVGLVLSAAPETLFAWKLHGLVEFGIGRWRAKDIFDLDLLWRSVSMNIEALRLEIKLAFSSHGAVLTDLTDFRTREAWGMSFSTGRKWRSFLKKQHLEPTLNLLEVRERLRQALDIILPK